MDGMHAVRAHRRGGPGVLRYEVAPCPAIGQGEVLVEVRCASVTRGELDWDATWTDEVAPGGRPRLPVIPSKEVSGVVARVGPWDRSSAPEWAVGDEVFGLIPFTRDGAAAQFTAVPAAVLAAKPPTLGHDRAAALPLAGLTALQALVRHGGLRRGQRVLVHGAAGGVGSFAVQIAGALGAEVTATAAGRDAAFVRELGATRVLDYAAEPFEDRVDGLDLVLDTVGGTVQDRSWRVLRPGGTLVSVAAPPPAEGPEGRRGVFFVVEPDREGLRELCHLVTTGQLTPVVHQEVPLAETPRAYASLTGSHRRGKTVIRVS